MSDSAVKSVHLLRRSARKKERELQAQLDAGILPEGAPLWAKGVKVEKAGLFQYVTLYTRNKGH